MSPRAWIATFACASAIFGPLVLLTVTAHARCRTHKCWSRVSVKRHTHWLRVHRPWVYAWRQLTARERQWAHCIATYETRGIPWNRKASTDTGNGYTGSTQWLASTWHAAGGTGLASQHTLHEQLVRTVRWAHTAGSSQWSTSRYCGAVGR